MHFARVQKLVYKKTRKRIKRKRKKKSNIPKSRGKYGSRIAKLAEAITNRIRIGIERFLSLTSITFRDLQLSRRKFWLKIDGTMRNMANQIRVREKTSEERKEKSRGKRREKMSSEGRGGSKSRASEERENKCRAKIFGF